MAAVALMNFNDADEDFDTWTKEQLRAALAEGLQLTAYVLSRFGKIWVALERQGDDLTALRKGLFRWVPLIGAGELAAEVVVAFAARPAVMQALQGMPLDEQR